MIYGIEQSTITAIKKWKYTIESYLHDHVRSVENFNDTKYDMLVIVLSRCYDLGTLKYKFQDFLE